MPSNLETLARDGFYHDEEGWSLLLNKPTGWSSFDVVKKIRTLLRVRKVGHAGTLDVNAEGLLIVLTEKKTPSMDDFSAMEKEYEGVMILGARTKSFDSEEEEMEHTGIEGISESMIQNTLNEFLGEQEQLPPMYSAAKHQGKHLYQYARQGIEIARVPKRISVSVFNAENVRLPEVQFRVICSKGTFIRSLVNDVGEKLGCGAYLKTLKRTRIGNFRLENALTVDRLPSVFYPAPTVQFSAAA